MHNARPSIHMLNQLRVSFVFHFLLFDFDFHLFGTLKSLSRVQATCIYVSRDYLISTNKDDYPRAKAGNYPKEIPNVEILKNEMDGQT